MGSPAKKAIVIGMDGASMEIVKNMVDWGHMPNLAKLVERGAWRPMVGVFPTLTPAGLDRGLHRVVAGQSRGDGFQHPRTGRAPGSNRVGHRYGPVQIGVHLEHL